LSNPPYIPEGDRKSLDPEVATYEPHGALFAGKDGLDTVRRLVSGAAGRLVPGGLLAFEIGAGQSQAALEIVNTAGFVESAVQKDHAGIPRVVNARKAHG
jgi:release factor glutamine methyltransferase